MRFVFFRPHLRWGPGAGVGSAKAGHSVRSPGLVALIRCLALTLVGAQAFADTALRHFDIQAQVAALALKEFARQADISLVFSSAVVANHQTVGIRGDFTVLDGLTKLLDGSGLSFKQVSPTTIAINAVKEAVSPQDPPQGESGIRQDPARNGSQSKGDTSLSHRGLFARMASLFALSGAILAGGHAYGQDSAAAAAQPATTDASTANTNTLQEVVVTGTATAGGVKKLDASFSITTASLEEIRDANPSSAADLLKIVPGLWAESSGGEAGANIELAGFPGGGDAPYVTYQINGSPIYPSSGNVSFMDNSSQFRIDESVQRAEVLQGGPGVVYSNGQLGATANFILRQGTAEPHGDIGLTTGTDHRYRIDGFYGGPLAQDWLVSFGGFYRYSDGVRDSQYPADDGGQLTATLSHKWDNGSVLFFGRELNDKNLFITDIPVTVSGTGNNQSVSAFPGFNPNTGTFAGDGLRGISVQEAPGAAPITADLANGRGADLHTFGNDIDVQITDHIAFANKMMYTAGEVDCYCLFNNFAPQTLSSFIGAQITTVNRNTAITGPYGAASTGTATLVSTGAAVNPNSYVASLGFWIVQKQIQSYTDDMRVSFELVPGNTLTVGGYLAAYSSDDHWWLGNNELVTAIPNAQLIDLTLNNGVNVTNRAGQLGASTFSLNENWTGLNTALFASDQWKMGQWLFDAGYRVEEQTDHGTVENDSAVDLDNDPRNLYNKGVSVPNGTFNQGVSCETSGTNECTEFRHTRGSWSLGANYEITPQMAVFGRINQGVHFPGFDDLRSGTPQTESIDNYEIGYRAQTQTMYGVIDVFHRKFTGVPFQQFIASGEQITASYGASSYGVNVEGQWRPIQPLSVEVSGNWQHSVYTSYASATSGGADYTGLTLQRQPRLQFRVTPAYDLPMDWGGLRFFATYTHVGLRYSDIANQEILPAYYTLDAGAVAEIGHSVEVRLQGTNLTNQIGLTEGNARVAVGSGSGISDNLEDARPIFGREVNVQLRYKF
jgi:outer membrane receptor protein involved in Fe transport